METRAATGVAVHGPDPVTGTLYAASSRLLARDGFSIMIA